MVYKRFTVGIIYRVGVIAACCLLSVYLWETTGSVLLIVIVFLLVCVLTYNLIRYSLVTNRELARFFDAIRYEDFSQTFRKPFSDARFSDLYNAMNSVIDVFKTTRAEKEVQYRYLQTIVRHIPVGLLSFDSNGKVEISNHALKRLLDIPYVTHLGLLAQIDPDLPDILRNLRTNEQQLIKVRVNEEILQLSLYATEFKLKNSLYKLVSLQNIGAELEAKEVEAWQYMIRVLAHEILNSVTPISSLAGTVQDTIPILKENVAEKTASALTEGLNDIEAASGTIKKRSDGLLRFVSAYRNLARIPQPEFKLCSVTNLFEDTVQLLSHQIQEGGIKLTIDVEPVTLRVSADPELIEQVLLNLVKNAVQAIGPKHEGQIKLRGLLDSRGRVILEVEDNGPGLSEEMQEKVFVPFFSTKESGSGIGLSFSRQVMQRHGGTIRLTSEAGAGTTIRLHF